MKKVPMLFFIMIIIITGCSAKEEKMSLRTRPIFEHNQALLTLFENINTKAVFTNMGDNYTFRINADLYESGTYIKSMLASEFLTLEDKSFEFMYNYNDNTIHLVTLIENRINLDVIEQTDLNQPVMYYGVHEKKFIDYDQSIVIGIYYTEVEGLENPTLDEILENASKAILIRCEIRDER